MANSNRYKGLTQAEVEKNRELYGSNIFTPVEKESVWKQFAAKFNDPLIIVLLVAGVLSVGISIYEYTVLSLGKSVFFEPAGIFIAIFLATGLSFYFERKADLEFEILNQVNDDEPSMVIRNGNVTSVARKDIVKGDIVILNTGSEIPADGILLEATSLNVDESSLTGEPICHKTTNESDFNAEATYPSNMVLRGTKVMEGHGVMEVTATGDRTENGKVFSASKIDDSVKTPLDEQLGRLGRMVTIFSYVIGAGVVGGRLLMYFLNVEFEWVSFITYFLQTIMIAVTLIVVSVPEGLPMAVTLSLAYSMRRMLKTQNLVRKLHACETMGATTVICTDKTGTLTQNKMQVKEMKVYGDISSETFNEGIAVNSTAQLETSGDRQTVLGNPTEGALLLWLANQDLDYRTLRENAEIVSEIPFTTERKYMATEVISHDGKRRIYVKGAPEIVFGLCSHHSDIAESALSKELLRYQSQAMRTLGFAMAELPEGVSGINNGELACEDLKFIGICAISDPVRVDVPAAVEEVRNAGIAVKIVTGDTPGTAKEIGRQIGLWDDSSDDDKNIMTGLEFESLTDEELASRVKDLKIIARARPMDKKRLVEALQASGEVVAVTGDGTNDAPALKAAHVGLSMGDGTSVAKEASDITIIDNSFASIGRAVMWGRSLYLNIQRFILFQLTVNVVACLIVLTGAFMGMESPLTVTQMLWVNLIMDTFAAVALASISPSRSVMKNKPRDRRAFIISRPMWSFILGVGTTFFIILLCLLGYLEFTDYSSEGITGIATTDVKNLTINELSVFFTVFVFLQFWNLFNAKAFGTERTALDMRGCRGFVTISLLIFIGQIVIVELGGEFFNVTPLSFKEWVVIIVATSSVLWVGETFRFLKRFRLKV
ncbi:MAG: calcium-translocating P-type ATPase, PMCA-type [Paramuribaculum sp.]|nr:calcium-translocating P-type ATPase, PMCA-type [Paramuribaculum sp.]